MDNPFSSSTPITSAISTPNIIDTTNQNTELMDFTAPDSEILMQNIKSSLSATLSPLETQIYVAQKFLIAAETETLLAGIMSPIAAAYYKQASVANIPVLQFTHQKLGAQDTSASSSETLNMLEGLQEKRAKFRQEKYRDASPLHSNPASAGKTD